MIIKLILALDKKGCIGKDNSLPWKLKDDLKHFKEITSGAPIIMGANTYKSLPGILPDREHLVISTSLDSNKDISVFTSIMECISYLKENNTEEVFLIGGANLVKQFCELKMIDEYILTMVDTVVEDGDTFLDFDDDLELYNWNYYKSIDVNDLEKNSHNFTIKHYIKDVKRFYS